MAIYVRLSGGLGNQIFQLAAAIYLRKNNEDIFINTSFLSSYKVPRDLGLDKIFDLNNIGIKICNSTFTNFIFITRTSKLIGVTDSNIKDYSRRKKNIYLDGYFQNFWSNESIANTFTVLKSYVLDCESNHNDNCVIHFRAADFLTDENFNIIPRKWYYDSILDMMQYTSNFIVVTDDIVFSKDYFSSFNFSNINIIYCSKDLISDFNIIRSHRYAIIGNSTFSITSTLLSKSVEKLISYPFFMKGVKRQWNLL